MLEEIVFFGNGLSAHQESASSLNIICNGKISGGRALPSCVVASFLKSYFVVYVTPSTSKSVTVLGILYSLTVNERLE